MADPQYPILVPKGIITKVATAITTGNLRRKSISTKYSSTYRMTGTAAPTDILDFAPMFDEFPNREPINNSSSIDIYVYCPTSDGSLRLDS